MIKTIGPLELFLRFWEQFFSHGTFSSVVFFFTFFWKCFLKAMHTASSVTSVVLISVAYICQKAIAENPKKIKVEVHQSD